jgi:2-polyprenyl-6-methoxyphenol hydroxylase-like FAD-dependent oxidoreductase
LVHGFRLRHRRSLRDRTIRHEFTYIRVRPKRDHNEQARHPAVERLASRDCSGSLGCPLHSRTAVTFRVALQRFGATGMRVGIVGGSIAGCAAAALLHRANHDVTVLERSESELVSRGAGILSWTAAWQHMAAHGLFDESLPACRANYSRLVTRATGTGQQRWLGDYQMSFTLFNWAHLYQQLRRRVPDDVYRSGMAVERIEATPHGATLHLVQGDSREFDLVLCADGYRSLGRGIVDPDAGPVYRKIVLWRGLLPERDIRVDALSGCDLLRPVYQGGHGIVYYIPGAGQSSKRGERLLMWGYYLQVPESDLASVLVDDQERQQSGSVPFGKVHPEVRAALETRLAGLLPSSLFEVVQQSGNSSIQAIYSCAPRSYVRERLRNVSTFSRRLVLGFVE